ncbi:hypothetical protein AJ79_07900 [Helicocarpus griseus UAMH5409]|uniref:Nephrocystin 3-like N-terminal domain-containing protein n=1 Tax=Helicocarpus griseus UAMH5409 TaxID=1447875 RepID=A0A2B7WY89_9EURO|nr:hypothetical protein AJ79_07900 [Helicocarpus griseus UAMH5409]
MDQRPKVEPSLVLWQAWGFICLLQLRKRDPTGSLIGYIQNIAAALSQARPYTWLNKYKEDRHDPLAVCTTELYCRIAQKFDQVILVIDALDECPRVDRHHLIRFLVKIMETLNAKIFVTSRREDDIADSFHHMNVPSIEIKPDDIAEDIRTFVTEEVKALKQNPYGRRLYLRGNSLEDIIIHSLTEKSDGIGLVRPLHYSLVEFITSSDFGSSASSLTAIQTKNLANDRLATICLSSLRNTSLVEGPKEKPRQLRKFLLEYPFIHYAARYFDIHIEGSQAPDGSGFSQRCLDGIDLILKNLKVIAAILQIREIHPSRLRYKSAYELSSWSEGSKSAFELSAWRGVDMHTAVFSTNLVNGQPIREKYAAGPPPKDALHRAAANGYRALVEQLIDDGREVNELNEQNMFPLYYACHGRHSEIASLLL